MMLIQSLLRLNQKWPWNHQTNQFHWTSLKANSTCLVIGFVIVQTGLQPNHIWNSLKSQLSGKLRGKKVSSGFCMKELDTNPVLFDCSKHQFLCILEQCSLVPSRSFPTLADPSLCQRGIYRAQLQFCERWVSSLEMESWLQWLSWKFNNLMKHSLEQCQLVTCLAT